MQHLSGLITACYTPMHADTSLNLDMIEPLAERCIQDEVAGVFICGATGEFASLSVAERISIAERWRAATADRLKLIVHVGGTCLSDCQHLAKHAAKIGADGISAIAPYFYKPATLEVLVDFCAVVSGAASHLPFYYYHLPPLSGVDFPMFDFLQRGADRIAGLAGIKYSNTDLMDMGRCVNFDGGRFNILFGVDEMLLSGLVLGSPGAVGTSYSFAAGLYNRIIEAFKSGDMETARQQQGRSMELLAIARRYGGHRGMKQIMKMIGLDCGPIRLPWRPLSVMEYDTMHTELDAIGFWEYCSQPEKVSTGASH